MRFIIVIVLFLLGIYGCTTDEKMPSQGVILLKHKVNSLDNISDYIEGDIMVLNLTCILVMHLF